MNPVSENTESGLTWIGMDKVKSKKVDWLWPGRIGFGSATLLDGKKGLGKSTIAAAVAAHVTGGPTLLGGKQAKPQSIIWLSVEESLGTHVQPRLKAAGAKIKKCIFPGRNGSAESMESLCFPATLEELEKGIRKFGVGLFVLDPLSSFVCPGYDLNNEQQARQIMEGLHGVAERTGAACLLIRHPRKTQGGAAIDQGLGSAGIAAVARSVLRVDPHPSDKDKRCLSVVACNLGQKAKSLIYSIEKVKGAGRLRVEGETDEDADELSQAPEEAGKKDAREDAKKLLKTVLAKGPVAATDVKKEAGQALIPDHALRDAKVALGVWHKFSMVGGQRTSMWHPPKDGWPKDQ